MAALVAAGSYCWAEAESCKGRYGEKNPDVFVGIDPAETPLKSVAVTFQGVTTPYSLELMQLNSSAEFYILHIEGGAPAGFRAQQGIPSTLRFNRKKQLVYLNDLWADQSIRAICSQAKVESKPTASKPKPKVHRQQPRGYYQQPPPGYYSW